MSLARNVQQLILAVVATSGLAVANAEEANTSVTVSGMLTSNDDESSATVAAAFEYYLFGQRLGLSPRILVDYTERETTQLVQSGTSFTTRETTTSSTMTGVGLGADFYFREVGGGGRLIPFIGVGFDFLTTSDDESEDSFDFLSAYAEAGLKLFLGERASLDGRVQYKSFQYDEELQDLLPDSEVGLLIGLSVYF
jgi:hypothetical protein